MAEDYSSFSLQLVNLFIGLCRGAAGLPDDLRRLGYRDRAIEWKFRTAAEAEVCPELILASEVARHTILCEWKSGGNAEADQLQRYSGVTQEDLQQRAFVPALACQSHDTALFGQQQHLPRLSDALKAAGCHFPLLQVAAHDITLQANGFASAEVDDLFSRGLCVDLSKVPVSFVPFDRESPDWVIAEHVCRQLVVYMTQQEVRLFLSKLAPDVCRAWEYLHPSAKKDLTGRMVRILDLAATHELRSYLRRNKAVAGATHTPTWEISASPADHPTDKRTSEWKRLRSQMKLFITSLRDGTRQLKFGF